MRWERITEGRHKLVAVAAVVALLAVSTPVVFDGLEKTSVLGWIAGVAIVVAVAAALYGHLAEPERQARAERLDRQLDATLRHADEAAEDARRLRELGQRGRS